VSSSLEDLLAHCVRTASSGEEFWSLVSDHLRQTIPFDGACWFGIDPSTLLANYPIRVENIDQGHCQSYWERECKVSDALLFRDLARSPVPAGTLYAATSNQPDRSPRYREYLAPQNFDDELRAAFRIGGRTWGAMDLYRQRGRDPFTEKDVALVVRAGTAIAGALRRLAVQERLADVSQAPEGTGTALFDHAGRLISFDDQADRWFTEIGGPQWAARPPSMSAVWAVVSRAANVHAGRDWGPSLVRLRTKDRQWVTLSASVLRRAGDPTDPGPVAVSVSRSVGWDVAPLLAEAYGLTPREQEVCEAAARGLSNQEIAAGLGLSAHTVRDHLKAVFAKVGITSRGELAARLFSDFYEPRILAPGADVVHAYF
jgi:DNA-binding CsgD family transcriptional regulator